MANLMCLPVTQSESMSCTVTFLFIFRIVGDNWDLEVKARYQTKSQNNKSLHYFHAYAVKDRIVSEEPENSIPQKSIDEIEMEEF